MAEGNNHLNLDYSRGRARASRIFPPPIGRAGITPRNLTSRNPGGTGMHGMREEGQIQRGRAGAPGMICNLVGRHQGVLLTWTGRRGRGRALAPPPLENHPLPVRVRRCQEGPLRCPHTYHDAFSPMVGSAVPPDIPTMTPMALLIMMIYFPLVIPLFVCGIAIQTPSLCITPHNLSFLTLHLPIPL